MPIKSDFTNRSIKLMLRLKYGWMKNIASQKPRTRWGYVCQLALTKSLASAWSHDIAFAALLLQYFMQTLTINGAFFLD